MIDPNKVTPLLANMSVDREIGRGPSGVVYRVTRQVDGRRMALKHISIPESSAQTKALIYAGAVANEVDAQRYYNGLVKEIKSELLQLNNIQNAPNLLKFKGYQVDQKLLGAGYDIYLLSDYYRSLPEFLADRKITCLDAVNLALDLASALEQLRSAGLVHRDVRPNNIFKGEGHFLLGDLGLTHLDDLAYSTIQEQQISEYTAPEVRQPDAPLTANMDIYSIGLILFEIFNGLDLTPLAERSVDEPLPAPVYADETMADIICKACHPLPQFRYQTPSEMVEDLVLYLQRNHVSDEPMFPQPEEPEEAPAEETDEAPQEQEAGADIPAEAAVAAAAAGVAAEGLASDEALPEEGEVSAENAEAGESAGESVPAGDTVLYNTDEINEEAQKDSEAGTEAASEDETLAATRRFSLNDIGDDDLLVPDAGEISLEDFLASIRSTPGLEVLSMDDDGKTVTMPGYETEETLPEDTEYVDSADSRIIFSPEEIDTATDDGLDYSGDETGYEPAELPELEPVAGYGSFGGEEEGYDLSEQVVEEFPVNEELSGTSAWNGGNNEEAPRRNPVRKEPTPVVDSFFEDQSQGDQKDYDDGYDDYDEADEKEDREKGSAWKKVLIAVIVLLVLAGGVFAAYTFKTDTITDMKSQVLSASSIEVTADSTKDTPMEVICSTATGEVSRVPLTEGSAVFTGLNPNTTYSFTMSSTASNLILGSKSCSGKTLQMTNLTAFSASTISAVSADLVIRGTGDQPESWVITCTGENGDVVSTTATDASAPIHVDGLTPATKYTAVIARGDGEELSGTTTYSFSTQGYTVLSSFEVADVTIDSATLHWEYSGTVPDNWSLTCTGTDGSTTTQEVTDTEVTVDGLTGGETYTFSLNCPSLEATELSTLNVGIPSVSISSMSAQENEDGSVTVTWDYTGDEDPAIWNISYSYESVNTVTPSLVTSDTNSVTLTHLIPKATYQVTIEGADEFRVGGAAEHTFITGEREPFTDYGCTDTGITLYAQGDENQEAISSFTTEQRIAFAIEATYEATEEDKNVTTLYVVRDSEGVPVFVYRNDDPGRSWSGNWTTARHTGDLPDMPQKPGSYSLEVYFDGKFLVSANFTVNMPGSIPETPAESEENIDGEDAETEAETEETDEDE